MRFVSGIYKEFLQINNKNKELNFKNEQRSE